MWDLQDKSKIDLGQQLPKIRLMCMIIAITQNAHYTNDLEPNYLQSKDNFKVPQPDSSVQLFYRCICVYQLGWAHLKSFKITLLDPTFILYT